MLNDPIIDNDNYTITIKPGILRRRYQGIFVIIIGIIFIITPFLSFMNLNGLISFKLKIEFPNNSCNDFDKYKDKIGKIEETFITNPTKAVEITKWVNPMWKGLNTDTSYDLFKKLEITGLGTETDVRNFIKWFKSCKQSKHKSISITFQFYNFKLKTDKIAKYYSYTKTDKWFGQNTEWLNFIIVSAIIIGICHCTMGAYMILEGKWKVCLFINIFIVFIYGAAMVTSIALTRENIFDNFADTKTVNLEPGMFIFIFCALANICLSLI